jgi:cytochrome c oxidase assembly factor CtaG
MSPAIEAALISWSISPVTTIALCLLAAVYLRGWWRLRSAGVPFVPPWRATTFMLGLFLLWLALASPLDTFSGFLLTAHMLQHMLLMMVAPPLILLGAPLIPLVRGLPGFFAREFAGPFLNWSVSKRVGHILASPICGLLLMGIVMFAWHLPKLFELALSSSGWHETEHACFFVSALIFWWPVVQPWPTQPRWPKWAMVPYLLVADLQNTALSAILIFSDRVLYPTYAVMPRLFVPALEDQAAAGAMMWVVGSLAFVLPAIAIAVQCLSAATSKPNLVRPNMVLRRATRGGLADSLLSPLWRIPLLRRLPLARLRGRAFQATSFLVFFVVIGGSLATLASSDASDDDNQVLRFKGQSGPFAVAVFTQSGELSPGPTHFGILIQDRNTQDVQLDATIDLTVAADSDAKGPSSTVRAARAEDENKLLQTAELNVPNEGDWKLHIAVKHNSGGAEFLLPLHVVGQQTSSGHAHQWSYIALLLLAAILLLVYAQRHRHSRSAHVENPAASP